MDRFAALIIPVLTGIVMIRMLVLPMRICGRLVLHGGCGFLCLWLLNSVAAFTGVYIPVNLVTVLAAGFLGVPGIGVMALLEMMR